MQFSSNHFQDNSTTIACHHGQMECDLNKHQSCAIKYLIDRPGPIPYIACLEDAVDEIPAAIPHCFKNAYKSGDSKLLQKIM
jgi:hypothetical protein